MKHVDHLLTSYTEGVLPSSEAVRVRQHIAACDSCREKLARHERLVADLHLTLGSSPIPREAQVAEWWQMITAPRRISQRRNFASIGMLPALLTMLAIILPMTIGIMSHASAPGIQSMTLISPAANTTNLAPAADIRSTEEPTEAALRAVVYLSTSTPASAQATTPAPAIPAPFAP